MSLKKFFALCLSFAIFICAYTAIPSYTENAVNISEDGTTALQGAVNISEDGTTALQGEGLTVNEKTGEFTLIDKNGYVWKSNPIFGGFDENSAGLEKTNQRSQLLIQYLDSNKNINDTNTFIDADRVVVEEAKNGVRIVYVFSELGFIIPLTLTYTGDTFTASIDTSKINERYDNKILNITVLPYFGAGKVGQEGYVFIPDGCGAIISFDESNAHIKKYQKDVYGENLVLYKKSESTVEEQIYLPVFGIKHEENSFLGIINEGDSIAKIRANADTGYYTVSANFIYRQNDTSHISEGSSKEKEVVIIPKQETKSDFSVTYVFQHGADSNYVGMAKAYREYLIDTYDLSDKKSDGISMDLSFTATAKIAKSFLGIPYTGIVSLTELDDIEKILDELDKNNLENYNLSLKGALGSGIYGKVLNKVKINSKVGNYEAYNNLNERVRERNGNFYLLANFTKIYKTGNGVSASSGTARDVSGAISKIYNFYPESFGRDESYFWRLINITALKKVTEAFAESAENKGISLGIFDMADELYGDYRLKNIYDRDEMLKAHKLAYEHLAKSTGSLYFQGANIYALAYAAMISSIPTKSSQYDMFTQDVPFYQTVLHGLVDYSSNAVNLSGEQNYSILKCIEYGSAVRYDLICRNEDILYKTSEKHLFASDVNKRLADIIKLEKEISDFYRSNSESCITAHYELQKDVYCTVYSNGNASIVNYGDKAVKINGHNIEAEGYIFTTEEKLS